LIALGSGRIKTQVIFVGAAGHVIVAGVEGAFCLVEGSSCGIGGGCRRIRYNRYALVTG